jgi:hypothetical protein
MVERNYRALIFNRLLCHLSLTTFSMSTASPPSYGEPSPSYSAEPGLYEERLAINVRSFRRATGNFIISSKNGNAKLRLTAQEEKIELPVYGTGGVVEGTVELQTKPDNISTVKVTVAPLCLARCPGSLLL